MKNLTVGEKIQYFRKNSGLSQEELGAKMLVSRQTVSLWEMDKTMPTVDNLLRLKEIFGVSVDEILDGNKEFEEDSTASVPANEPLESYSIEYTKADLQEYTKAAGSSFIKRALISVVLIAVLFVNSFVVEYPDWLAGFFIGCFAINFLSALRVYIKFKKETPLHNQRVMECSYLYEVYEDSVSMKIFRDGELKRYHQLQFSDITRVLQEGGFLVFGNDTDSYLIKKSALPQDSRLRTLRPAKKPAQKKVYTDAKGALNTLSIVLFICSILTIFGASLVINQFDDFYFITDRMWIFFLFLPIPLASLLLSFYLKHKGYRYMKNLIVGLIMIALLCIYGSFTFVFSDIISHDDAPILRVEEKTEIDIPKHKWINTTKLFDEAPNKRELTKSTSDVYFEKEVSDSFEKALADDPRWLSSLSTGLIGLATDPKDPESADYFLLYNEQTGEFNTVPKEEGVYEFINLFYDCDDDVLYLVEYELEYKK